MEGKNLYLKPEEAKFLSMAVLAIIDDLQDTSKNVQHNWTPEVRKDLKEMLAAGATLKIKMAKLGFDMRPFEPLKPGEERDYLTKES